MERESVKLCKLCSKLVCVCDTYFAQGYCNGCGAKFTRKVAEKQASSLYLRAATSGLTKPVGVRGPSTIPRNPPTKRPPPVKDGISKKHQQREGKRRGGFRCNRCGDFGHMAAECRTKICTFCQTRGHLRDQCFSNPDNCCEKCGTYGHTIVKCRLCERCGDFGHGADECRTKICDDCGRRGHKKDTCWSRKVCERCDITGHIAKACRTRLWCEDCQEAHRKCGNPENEERNAKEAE